MLQRAQGNHKCVDLSPRDAKREQSLDRRRRKLVLDDVEEFSLGLRRAQAQPSSDLLMESGGHGYIMP